MRLDKYSKGKNSRISCGRIDNSIQKRQPKNNIREQEWLKENKEAIEKQNECMKKRGLFGDVYRRF